MPLMRYIPCVLLLMIFSGRSHAQDQLTFRAFGQAPKTIKDSLYIAYKEANKEEDKFRLAQIIGQTHLAQGDVDSALHYAKLSSDHVGTSVLKKINYQLLLGKAKLEKGLVNDSQKAFLDGLAALSTQTKEEKRLKNWLQLGLSRTYLSLGEYTKAVPVLDRLSTNPNDTIASKALYYKAYLASKDKDTNKAKSYLERASLLVAEEDLPKFKMQVQLKLAQIAQGDGETETAFNIYEYLINTSLTYHFYDIYTESVLGYGQMYRDLKQYDAAQMTLSIAYANSLQWNRMELQRDIINSLRRTYAENGDYENAYNLMTQHVSITNQILEQQNSDAVKELEVKYQTLQKENQILALKESQIEKQNEIDRQKTIKKAFLYGFLALLIPIIALLVVYYQKLQAQSQLNQKQQQLNAQEISTMLNEQELALAKTSLNAQQEERSRIAKQLHDSIGGNLAGIKLQLSHSVENGKAAKDLLHQVDETYELVRDISHNLTPKKFNTNNYTVLIQHYLDNIRINSDCAITFSAHPESDINHLEQGIKIELYQIIQELMTNCLKHAQAKNVAIHLNKIHGSLQLIFEDDGIGFDTKSAKAGIGLKNLRERTKANHGELHIDSSLGRGTVISLEIPLDTTL
ncbi:Two-component system-sensor histidine kinase [Croceitalea dokdonensis DOKDO 023]|uniref:histidine kinase n=2 Tax=Croceitalea TaxID=574891 RepID=A0A0N8H3U7_9FLAO|nr:Two-component system-sensor histidine kinase [Croceitalea dokdonensis DOKDO 023]